MRICSFHRIFSIVALTALASSAANAAISCTFSSATVTPVRLEGRTEQVGDFILMCSNTGTSGVTLAFKATLSQNVTSKALGSTGNAEVAAVVLDSASVQPTTVTPGTVSGNQVSITATVPPNTTADSGFLVDLTNIRIDATALSLGGQVTEQVQVSQGTSLLTNIPAQPVAVGVPGLNTQTISGISTPPGCFAYTAATPAFRVNFGENSSDPLAFKVQGGAANSSIGSWYSNNTETGYYVSSGGSNNQASSGTRLRVQFTGLPSGASVYMPLALSSSTASSYGGAGTVVLTATESGAFSAVPQAGNPSGYTGSAALGQLTVTNGTAEAVYEVTSANVSAETYSAPVYLVGTGAVGNTGGIQVAVSFAPVGAASNVPNFAQTSSSTALTAPNCLTITSSASGTAVQNFAFSQTLSALGGTSPYTWTIASGSPPTGINLTSGGVLSGVATSAPGMYSFKVQAMDNAGTIQTQSFSLTVNPQVSVTTSATLPAGAIGEPYRQTLTATGGNGGPYSWTPQTLPGGLTVSSGGIVSGTPGSAGTYNFTATATDSASGASGALVLSLTINGALTVTAPAFPVGEVGVTYGRYLTYTNTKATATGGIGSQTWSLISGAEALNGAGLSFSASGVLSGVPSASGSFPITLQVSDQGGGVATAGVTVIVNAAPVISAFLPAGLQNNTYTATLTATRGSGAGYTWTSATLPSGFNLSTGGVLSGYPTVAGNYTLTFRVSDSAGGQSSQSVPLFISPAGTVINTNLPNNLAIVNVSATVYGAASFSGTNQIYWQQPFTTGNAAYVAYTLAPGAYTFRVINPTDAAAAFPLTSGQLNSIYTAWTYNSPWITSLLAFSASAVSNPSQNQLFSIAEIDQAQGSAAAAYNRAVTGGFYNQIFVGARNATPTYSYTFSTPTTLIFAVPDSGLGDNSGGVSVLIAPVAATQISVSTTTLPGGFQGSVYKPVTLSATGGSGIYNWSATNLPAGMTLSASGSLSGTPTAAGTFSGIVVTATDSVSGATAAKTLTLQISGGLSITTAALPNGVTGQAYSVTLAGSGGSGNSANYSWSATGLPSTLTLSTAGVLSGTPTATGVYSVTITLRDTSTSQTASSTLSLTVNTPITFNYLSAVQGTAPLGYFRLENTSGSSEIGGYTYTSTGATVQTGAPIGQTNGALSLNGNTGAITTSLRGGIGNAATIVAWVNLSQLPSNSGQVYYIAGESQVGNDLDLQFTNNAFRFYTTSNAVNIGYQPDSTTLVNQWHMVAATFLNQTGESVMGSRAIYWDGVQVASDAVVSTAGKTAAFNIGATPVFPGRNFPGAIDEVGVWSSALSATQIAQIYAAASASLPPGVSGSGYPAVTLTANGGSGNFTWTATGLPAGITLSSGGMLSGTPTAAGTSNPVFTITDANSGATLRVGLKLTINGPVSIQTTALPALTTGAAYSANIAVTGGIPPYSYTVTTGALPAGITLNANTGGLSGTPTATGSGSFMVQVYDFSGGFATQQITWTVSAASPLTITTTSLPAGAKNSAYSQTLAAANNTGSVTWTLASGSSLPTGLALSTAGVLSGTPTVSGTFTFTVMAVDQSSNTAMQALTLTLNPALTISTANPPAGAVGETYSATLSASGGIGSYTWSLQPQTGSLPGGVTLSAAGVLSGTPTAAGNFSFTVKVTDTNNNVAYGAVTVTVNGPLTITTTSLPPAIAGVNYSQTLAATGGVGTYTWSVSGLPSGMTVNPSTGAISGSVSAVGSVTLTLKVTDSNSFTASLPLILTINNGSLSVTTTTLPSATNGTAYTATLSASGGTTPYTWSILGGTFTAAGLTLSSAGAIGGTPNTTGTLSFTVQLKDANNLVTTQLYALTIAPATPPTYDFAVANQGGAVLRISDLPSRDAVLCPANTCASYAVTADSLGNIYSRSKTGITKITPGGAISTVLNFSTTSPSSLATTAGVGGLALDGLGNIIFTDNVADALFRVKTDGTGFTQVAAYPNLSPTELQDTFVAVDRSGNYIVADDAGGQIMVYKFTRAGTPSVVLSSAITGSRTSGLVIDALGNYDILDYVNFRLLAVSPSGTVTPLFSTTVQTCCQALGLAIEGGTSNFIFGVSGTNLLQRVTPLGAITSVAASTQLNVPFSMVSIPAPSVGPLTVSPNFLPNGTSGQAYGPVNFSASGGSGNYTWSGTGFPSGIGISATGTVGGTTSLSGAYIVTVTATDTVTAQTGSATFTISFATPIPPLTITQTAAQLSTALGGSVSASYSASGGMGTYTFSASGLPPGVNISSAGAVSGTPTQAGNFSASVLVTDQQPRTASFPITVSVLGLTSGSLPAGVAGTPYSGSLGAVGGSGTYTFTATGLPAGLTLSSGGSLAGTVKTAGSYTLTVKVTDGGGLTVSGSFTLVIAAPPALTITSTSLSAGNVGTPYGQSLSATGGFPPYTWSQSGGSLPAGMSLSSTGVVSGTPTAPGSYSFGVLATDASGGVTTAGVSLTIQPAPLTITTPSPLASGIAGLDYPMQAFTASGGTGTYTFSLTSGSLPAGLTFSGGVLSGNTASAGTYSLGVTVTDSASAKATANYSLTIRAAGVPDLILSSGSVSFTVNNPSSVAPPSQNVNVQSSVAGTPLNYTLAVSPAASWLAVQNGSSTPDSIQLSLTSAALTLAAGSYNTTLTLTCTSSACAGRTQSASVALTVTNALAALSVGTSLLSFGLSTASPVPSTQSISVSNSGGGTLTFGSTFCEASWCTVSGVPGTLTGGQSASIGVTVDPNKAGPGFSRTQVDIVTSAGKASVPVTALVATNPTMTLAPVGQQFSMQTGSGPGNPNGSFLVTVANGSINWTAATSGAPWLVLGTASGSASPSQPGTVTFSIGSAAAGLAPGPYYATIQVTSSGVVNSPQSFEVVLNVAAGGGSTAPDPQPGGLLFITYAATTPPQQTVMVYTSSPAPLAFQTAITPSSAGSWLAVSAATGMTSQSAPGSVQVTVNPAKLSPGTYTAGVSFSLSAAAVRTVNVTVIVTPAPSSQAPSPTLSYGVTTSAGVTPKAGACAGTALAPAQVGLVSNFSTPVAWPTPLTIAMADNCGSLVTNGQIVATFSNGDPPLALSLADPARGTYSATWTPRTSAAQMSITARATAPGYPTATAQIAGTTAPNKAPVLTPHGTLHSFAPAVGGSLAPGTIVQIYGQNLAAGTSQPTAIPLPTSSGGTQVIIGGIPAPLYYVSPGQINAQLPFELTPLQPYQVVISANGALTTPDTVNVTPAVPGFAAFGDGTLIAQHGDGSLVSATAPARGGEYLVSYLAGLGATNATPASGAASPGSPLAVPSVMPTLTINGQNAPIAFAGLTPGLVGLYQMNFQVPSGLPAGDISLVLSQGGTASNQTVLPYKP